MLWADYDKSRPAPGDAHMIGRGQVERALRSAGATIESLSLGPRVNAQGDTEEMIFDLSWVDAGRSGHLGLATQARLLIRWNAAPARLRALFAPEVCEKWLPLACAWAAAAPKRGNAWAATDHRWMVVHRDGALRLIETDGASVAK